MSNYYRKAAPVSAVQFRGNITTQVRNFLRDCKMAWGTPRYGDGIPRIRIQAHTGTFEVEPQEWIVRDASGKVYTCKPDAFELEYEMA